MDTCTTFSRKRLSLTLTEIAGQWLSKPKDFHCWDHSPFTPDSSSDWQVPYLTPHTPHSHSQNWFPHWIYPRLPVTVSDIQFHKAIFSWHINTKTAPAVLYQQRNGWAFIPSQHAHRKFLLFLQSTSFLLSLPVSIHLAATTCLPALC